MLRQARSDHRAGVGRPELGWLLEAGVSGWAVGYCSAKLASESFLVFLPLIANKARAEEAVDVHSEKAATSS